MPPAVALSPNRSSKILWMEDEPVFVRNIATMLRNTDWPFDIEIADSIPDARAKIAEESYCGFVVDLRMDEDTPAAHNGAQILVEINKRYPALPTFVMSAYLNDPMYTPWLEKARPIYIGSKNEAAPVNPMDMPLMKAIREHAARYQAVIADRPEFLVFSVYVADPDRYRQVFDTHWKRHGQWIQTEMKRVGARWCVVCGNEIVKWSADMETFPEEDDLRIIGRNTNLVPFAYTAPLPVESIPAANVGVGWVSTREKGDYYPTIHVGIGGNSVVADLDTGATQSHLCSSLVTRNLFSACRSSTHLGKQFEYYSQKIPLTVQVEGGIQETIKLTAAVVLGWDASPFVIVNPARKALIGRDLLLHSRHDLVLSGSQRRSFLRADGNVGRVDLFPPIEPLEHKPVQVSWRHTLYTEVCGTRAGKQVVFLHGGPGAGCDEKARRLFDPAHFCVYLFDQRGCGRSTPRCSLEENTTADLVEDIERVRVAYGVRKWIVVGGSWGSALALAYAQAHPECVSGMVLRGVFLLRRAELAWFYQHGASVLFPDAWEDFVAPVPMAERGNLLSAYQRLLASEDEEERTRAAMAWTRWEMRLSTLKEDVERVNRAQDKGFALTFASIECHYFMNAGFFGHEGALLDSIDSIRSIPCIIVQGRYDVVCPMATAWDLHQAWPEASFRVVDGAGHSAYDPAIQPALLQALEEASQWPQ
jgi:proline iminopeptidase